MPPPPPPFRMVFQGFTNESSMWLVIRQGETGMLRIRFTRQYTNETLSMRLWLDSDDGNLPEGISYTIDPYLLELSTDADYSVNLTIVASPNARVGNFTMGLGGLYYRVGVDDYNSQFGQGFTLEIGQSVPATGGIDFRLLAIIGVVIAAIALMGLTVVEYRRRKLLRTSQRPPQQTSPSDRLELSETESARAILKNLSQTVDVDLPSLLETSILLHQIRCLLSAQEFFRLVPCAVL